MAIRSSGIKGRIGGVAAVAVISFLASSVSADGQTGSSGQPVAPGLRPVANVSDGRQLLDKYCVTCHNDRLKTAGLSFEHLDPSAAGRDAPTWEKVVKKLRSATMPPPGVPRPDAAAVAAFASSLEESLDTAAETNANPGWKAIHRLNRAEYGNAIRDLLALDIDVARLLPVDDAAYGFDNIATLLSMSPGLLNRYLVTARRIAELAIPHPDMKPIVDAYDISKALVQSEARMSEDLPFGSVGGTAIRHYFPLDGDYVAKVTVSGNDELEIRLDGARIGTLKGAGAVGNTSMAPAQEIRFSAKAGMRVMGLSFVDKTSAPEGLRPAYRGGYGKANAGLNRVEIAGPFNASRTRADTPTRQAIFICQPAGTSAETPCAMKILAHLARRAYRRPVADADVRTLVEFYRTARAKGETFEGGIRRALVRLLVSPEFLYRIEWDPASAAKEAHRVNGIELASRLSFFLWSSIPDEPLLQAAEGGRLNDPSVLEAQLRRMLKDPRSSALVTNFASQWLYLRNLRSVTPDVYQFPEFDDNLRDAMRRETELFVESQLRDDRPVIDLLEADYTFVNERLARHYGIPNVYGSRFRRVPTAENRRGLLGQASILTVTSLAHRTSVVQRGKWILENILGAPVPAPPPGVPPLEENSAKSEPKSLRDRMEQHRKSPVCSACHARMDPVGFALENFDAVGEWRTVDAGMPIDASGALPDGTKLSGAADLVRAILARREQFVTTFTEKLLTYALGRGVEYYDQPAIRRILREAAPSDYRWSALILSIVKSLPFQQRVAPDAVQSARSEVPGASGGGN